MLYLKYCDLMCRVRESNDELKIELSGVPLKRPMSSSGLRQTDDDDDD